MQGKEIGRNGLAHRWCLIYYYAYHLHIRDGPQLPLFYGGKLFQQLLMHRQIVSRGNSTGLGHINILLDLSSTRDYRMLLCMIGIIEKILGLWCKRN